MYDQTTAFEEFLFSITIPTEFTFIVNLLSPSDLDILSKYIDIDGKYCTIDGYVVSYQDTFEVRINGGSGVDKVEIGEKYQDPTYNWISHLEVKALSDISANVRLFVARGNR